MEGQTHPAERRTRALATAPHRLRAPLHPRRELTKGSASFDLRSSLGVTVGRPATNPLLSDQRSYPGGRGGAHQGASAPMGMTATPSGRW